MHHQSTPQTGKTRIHRVSQAVVELETFAVLMHATDDHVQRFVQYTAVGSARFMVSFWRSQNRAIFSTFGCRQ